MGPAATGAACAAETSVWAESQSILRLWSTRLLGRGDRSASVWLWQHPQSSAELASTGHQDWSSVALQGIQPYATAGRCAAGIPSRSLRCSEPSAVLFSGLDLGKRRLRRNQFTG